MIIEPVGNRDTDAASVHTLVPEEKIPSYLVPLTYGSIVFSTIPFLFSLVNLVRVPFLSPLFSIPTILSYVFTIPFHVASLLVAWQHARQVDPTLPFEPTSTKTLLYTAFLTVAWTMASITCGVGSRRFVVETRICDVLQGCKNQPIGPVLVTFAISSALAAVEMAIVLAILCVSFKARPRKKEPDVEDMQMESIPTPRSHKVLSP